MFVYTEEKKFTQDRYRNYSYLLAGYLGTIHSAYIKP